MSNDEIFDADFEGRALAELTLDVSRSWSAEHSIAGGMRAMREWTELTFHDFLPLIGVDDVDAWIDRFSKSFIARMQQELDSVAGSATE